MGFAVGIWEFLIISGTVAGAGSGIAYREISRRQEKSNSSDPVLKQPAKEIIELTQKEKQKQEEEKAERAEELEKTVEIAYKESIDTSELILKDGRRFNFKDNSNSNKKEEPISVIINFALEPDSVNWEVAESQEFKLPSETSIIKRWVKKNESGNEGKKECRFSWTDDITKIKSGTTGGVATNFYEELKKLIDNAKTKCTNAGGKGLTDTSSTQKEKK